MATDMEKAQVTELHVRMDCNGCVQRIKKAVHSIDGIYDAYVDLPQQKLTVVGRADPETIVKAIKKTRKVATICSHTEPAASEPPPSEPEAASNPPAAHAADQPPSEAPPAESTPPTEPPKDVPPQENPTTEEAKPSPEAQGANPSGSKDVEEVHMAHRHHYPHGHVIREHWNDYPPKGHQIRHEAPYYVTQSYNAYKPSPYVSGHGYLQSPPQDMRYHTVEAYGDGYYQNRGNEGYYQSRANEGRYQSQGNEGYYQNRGSDGNQITSMFSDENPNACGIV